MNEDYKPVIDNKFVEPEISKKILPILKSRKFFPFTVVGPTGAGKTYPIMQICARENIPLIRVNMTYETTENELIGGFRLDDPNGNTVTVFEEGPVIKAMETGSILLLDEIDLATPQTLQCLMSILEGNGLYVKQTNKWIKPNDGFNIVATANTKGHGDDTGKYISTNILNEAFLERFVITIDADYPSKEIEKEILMKFAPKSEKFIDRLIEWANQIRESVKKNGDLVYDISTRRLVHIMNTLEIFTNEREAVMMCINRFDTHHRDSFISLYDSLGDSSQIDDNIEDEIRRKFEQNMMDRISKIRQTI